MEEKEEIRKKATEGQQYRLPNLPIPYRAVSGLLQAGPARPAHDCCSRSWTWPHRWPPGHPPRLPFCWSLWRAGTVMLPRSFRYLWYLNTVCIPGSKLIGLLDTKCIRPCTDTHTRGRVWKSEHSYLFDNRSDASLSCVVRILLPRIFQSINAKRIWIPTTSWGISSSSSSSWKAQVHCKNTQTAHH